MDERYSAYPIPLKGDEPKWWTFYQGKVTENGVEVDGNINEIYSNGFFGKGNLSKNGPTFEIPPSSNLSEDLSPESTTTFDESEYQTEPHSEIEINEKLILSFEEAFFLMYAVPCIIANENGSPLNLDQSWKLFSQLSSNNFPTRYAVYHYFRSKGWVPKSGLKYGVDYVIYKDGPAYNHSQYSVIITVKNSNKLTWMQLAGLNRINSNCKKEILFCNVWVPNNVESPDCIKNFKIEEYLFKRWVAAEERNLIDCDKDLPVEKK